MNILSTLSEALETTRVMDRESDAILGFYTHTRKRRSIGPENYSPYLRRRNRNKKAA